MIFTLSQSGEEVRLPVCAIDTDVFCFFNAGSSIKIPAEFWGRAVLASLKLKKNVLILEQVVEYPSPTTRWMVAPSYLWLAPRSFRPFSQALDHFSSHYPSIKKYLSEIK